jgi:hypothetical protein
MFVNQDIIQFILYISEQSKIILAKSILTYFRDSQDQQVYLECLGSRVTVGFLETRGNEGSLPMCLQHLKDKKENLDRKGFILYLR